MTTNDEILRQLAELRAENEKLRQQVGGNGAPAKEVKPTTTYVSLWKGNPVLRFEGAFRPFGIGLKKASLILEKIDDVRFFVENNRHRIDKAPDDDEN